MRDLYYDLILEYYDYILKLYSKFTEYHPIMEYDVQEQKIYAYPYEEYWGSLSPGSQVSLKEQYENALQNDEIVVFVRDSKYRKLRSYTMEIN